jgi:RNA polymerase sigma-70 factor (ECF subfamily)
MAVDYRTNPGITLSEIYTELQPELRRFALSLARDADAADDLVSETMLKAMANLSLLGSLAHYQRRAWLYRVLKNLFYDGLRSQRRQQRLLDQLGRMDDEPAVYALPADLLEQVPERFRELLNLRFCLGMSSEEIGAKLGIPAATARSRLHLATQWLRKNLEQ